MLDEATRKLLEDRRARNPATGTTFCFRCGGEPRYQLTLILKPAPDMPMREGPFWPLCYECCMEMPWEQVLRNTVRITESSLHEEDV